MLYPLSYEGPELPGGARQRTSGFGGELGPAGR
jgi:hypothetical protein